MLSGVTLLGDPHLGKKFITGVPLHRLGEREAFVWNQFENSLQMCQTLLHVCVGDLFEAMHVSETTVLRAAGLYKYYAAKSPSTKFVVYRGNHDASRDTSKKSSFDVFAEILAGTANIFVFKDSVGTIEANGKTYGFLPWSPFKTADILAFDLVAETRGKQVEAVFCHCDIDSFGGSNDNLIPTQILSQITGTVVTGHVHTPDEYDQGGVHVIVTGSMQPYSHGEDLKGLLYKSLTLEEFHSKDPEEFEQLNLRILLQPGEVLPAAPNCLSFIGKAIPLILDDDEEDDSEQEVGFDAFNMEALFLEALGQREVGAKVAEKIQTKYRELKIG